MEILKFIFANAEKLQASDLLLILGIVGCIVGSALYVINWIYKHAFDKQKEVIQSQDKLIELKNQAIADYERRVQLATSGLAEMESKFTTTLSELGESTRKHEELEEKHKQATESEAGMLIYAARATIGLLIARILLAHLDKCRSFRSLIVVYEAICLQHKDYSGANPRSLLRKIHEYEDLQFEKVELLRLASDSSGMKESKSIPQALFDFNADAEDRKAALALEEYLIPNMLPILTKYEPTMAARLNATYETRRQIS